MSSSYNCGMARGWESKSVEEQISAREVEAPAPVKKGPSPAEVERRAKRDQLLLARTRTITALQTTRDEGYREMLERALQHLDSELAGLGK
jgi:hypothetical protein